MTSIQAHLDQLDLMLGHQVAAMTALKNWLPRKIELIKKHQLADLEAFNSREEEQVGRLQQAESQRQVLVTMIALELGLDGKTSLSELLPHVPSTHRERLTTKADQLKALIQQIKEGHALASELLRVSLEYVHFSMDIFAQLATAAPPTGYSAGHAGFGDMDAPPSASASWLVDRQA